MSGLMIGSASNLQFIFLPGDHSIGLVPHIPMNVHVVSKHKIALHWNLLSIFFNFYVSQTRKIGIKVKFYFSSDSVVSQFNSSPAIPALCLGACCLYSWVGLGLKNAWEH